MAHKVQVNLETELLGKIEKLEQENIQIKGENAKLIDENKYLKEI